MQAIGILTTTEKHTDVEALERLRTLALASGHSMRTVAGWVIEERPRGTSMASRDQLPGSNDRLVLQGLDQPLHHVQG